MRDDIIRMAREAKFFPDWNWDRTNWHAAGFSDSFEHLVELVRAAEREACAARLEANAMACENPAHRSLLQANADEIRTLKGAT